MKNDLEKPPAPQPPATVPEMVAYAAAHPIRPGVPLEAHDPIVADLGADHLLMVVVEWSVPDQAFMYHASLSRKRGEPEPLVGISLAMLATFQELLGIPARWALHHSIVHWFWRQEDDQTPNSPEE